MFCAMVTDGRSYCPPHDAICHASSEGRKHAHAIADPQRTNSRMYEWQIQVNENQPDGSAKTLQTSEWKSLKFNFRSISLTATGVIQ